MKGSQIVLLENIQTIINDSLQEMAPVTNIQISEKNKTTLSEEVRLKMIERNLAFEKARLTKKPEDTREYKNLRNLVNNQIAKEKFYRKFKKFHEKEMTMGDKWKAMKEENWTK